MLAQNFKTPTDLGITDAEFDALSKVLGMLERGEIKGKDEFDMGCWYNPSECGTAGCIAGWAHHVSGRRAFTFIEQFRSTPRHLEPLFLPFADSGQSVEDNVERMRTVTQPQAAIALRNFLTHGEPRWEEAPSDHQT